MSSKWKYNKEKHSADEQPTQGMPLANIKTLPGEWKDYDKHIASLRSLPVQGKVSWADGEDVTGKFTIERSCYSKRGGSCELQLHSGKCECEVTIPIIQEPVKHCKYCGRIINDSMEFCDENCEVAYAERKRPIIQEQPQLIEQPVLIEKFADNGAHSHWELVNDDGQTIWSEENQSQGQQSLSPNKVNDIDDLSGAREVYKQVAPGYHSSEFWDGLWYGWKERGYKLKQIESLSPKVSGEQEIDWKAFEIWIKENNYKYRQQITTKNDKNELVESKVGLWYSWGGQSVGGKPLRELYKEFKKEYALQINPETGKDFNQ